MELEARSELALRTAAEFKLQRKDSDLTEEAGIDHRQPRLAGTRPLSYQKKRSVSTRTEKDKRFTVPSLRTSDGWIVEAPRTTEVSEALAYGIEPSDSSVRYTWYQDHFSSQKGLTSLKQTNEHFWELISQFPTRQTTGPFWEATRTLDLWSFLSFKRLRRVQPRAKTRM